MTHRLTVGSAAERDLFEAANWYDRIRPGLGSELLDEIDGAFARIAERPRAFPEVHRKVRRLVLRRFPYLVYFRIEGERVRVIACLHAARSTAALEER